MMIQRFSLVLIAALALSETTSVDAAPAVKKAARKLRRRNKKQLRIKARNAANTCGDGMASRGSRASIVDMKECEDGGSVSGTVAFIDRLSKQQFAIVELRCEGEPKVACGNRCTGENNEEVECDGGYCAITDGNKFEVCMPYAKDGGVCGNPSEKEEALKCNPRTSICAADAENPLAPSTCMKKCRKDRHCGDGEFCRKDLSKAEDEDEDDATSKRGSSKRSGNKKQSSRNTIGHCVALAKVDEKCGVVGTGFTSKCDEGLECFLEQFLGSSSVSRCKQTCDENTACPEDAVCGEDNFCIDTCDDDDDCLNDSYFCRAGSDGASSVCIIKALVGEECGKDKDKPSEEVQCSDSLTCAAGGDGEPSTCQEPVPASK